jgi:hypothetical protein
MNEIKFSCPSCKQHIQCDPSHIGENVPCPGCATLIRVPGLAELAESPIAENEDVFAMSLTTSAEKVSYAPAQPTDNPPEKPSEQFAPNGDSSDNSASPSSETGAEQKTAAVAASHSLDLHCVCPVCQARLQISIKAEPASDDASALAPKPASEPLSLAERERQIEAARKNQAATLYPQLKPRLDKILETTVAGH